MQDRTNSRGYAPASPPSWWAEVTQNRMIAVVLAMILAVPLLASPLDLNWSGTAAITLQGFALVLATMLLWRAKWDVRPESIKRFLGTSSNLPILLFAGLIALSCAFSAHKGYSIQELLRTGSGVLLYFVIAYQFRQSKHLSLLANTLLGLSAAVALGGMAHYQLFTEDRAAALFGNAQPLASFVMILLPVVAALAFTDKSPNRRMVAMVVGILMAGCLMLTQGRSAVIGTLAGFALLGWLVTRPVAGKKDEAKIVVPLRSRKHVLVWPALLAVVLIGFLTTVRLQNDSITNRAFAGAALSTDGSWQQRVQSYWTGAGEMIRERPLSGWGTGLYPIYQHQFTGQGAVISPDGPGTRVSLAEQAHNLYLQTAVELGLPGLLLLVTILGLFLYRGVARVQEMEAGIRRTLLIGALGSTVAFSLDAMASPSWQYGQTAIFFWLVLGMGTACLRPRVKTQEQRVQAHAPSRGMTLITRPMALGAALIIVSLMPTGLLSAQAAGYNGDGGNKNVGAAIVGTAGLLYLLSVLAAPPEGGTIILVPGATPTPTPTGFNPNPNLMRIPSDMALPQESTDDANARMRRVMEAKKQNPDDQTIGDGIPANAN